MTDAAIFVLKRVKERGLDALVCPGDVYAFDIRRILMENGVQVPRNLAITGFDDLNNSGGEHITGLTSLRIPWVAMIRNAIDILARKMQGEEMPVAEVKLQPELIMRESSRFGQ